MPALQLRPFFQGDGIPNLVIGGFDGVLYLLVLDGVAGQPWHHRHLVGVLLEALHFLLLLRRESRYVCLAEDLAYPVFADYPRFQQLIGAVEHPYHPDYGVAGAVP